jgi:hypothetical protein
MAKLYRLEVSKAHLDRMPEDECIFYLMASQLSNDLNILGKLLIFAWNGGRGDDAVRRHVAIAQQLLLIKMLAGRLHEGRALMNKAFSKRLWNKYKDHLTPNGRTSYVEITRSGGLLEKIRNKFAFHFDVPVVKDAYAKIPSDATFVDYLAGEQAGHSLHFGGEMLSLAAMIAITGEANGRLALRKIFDETARMATLFSFFIQSFVGVMLSRHLGVTAKELHERRIEVDDDPPIDEVNLPFFSPPSRAVLEALEASGGSWSWLAPDVPDEA